MGAAVLIGPRDLRADKVLEKHADWAEQFLQEYREKGVAVTPETIWPILQEETGKVFARVLEDAGVYKCSAEGRAAFGRFLKTAGFREA